jgi:hypothetical protein
LLLAQLLDLHLSRTIDRHKGRITMAGKFRELAAAIKGDLKNFDDQATELMARREDLRRRGETVFAKHRENLDDVEGGLAEMEAALSELEGSNSKNGEGSGSSSESFRKDG